MWEPGCSNGTRHVLGGHLGTGKGGARRELWDMTAHSVSTQVRVCSPGTGDRLAVVPKLVNCVGLSFVPIDCVGILAMLKR
jgi:hypothetical protein